MSHRGVRLMIEEAAKGLRDDLQFTYARTSDFNVMRDKKYPFVTLDPMTSNPQYATDGVTNYMKAWNCQLAFYMLDSTGSDQDEYATILDQTDDLVDRFINSLNFNTQRYDFLIQNINQTPFVKATSDILTGHILTFTLFVQDNFDYCSVYEC